MWRVLMVVLGLSLVGCETGRSGAGSRSLDSGRDPTSIYDNALTLMKRGMYDRSLEEFQELRNFHRDDPLSVKAQLGIADIHYKKGDFEEARVAYEEFAAYHPRHPDLDYVTYRIGLCIWKRSPRVAGRDQSTTRAAVNTWTGFDVRYPDSDYAPEVSELLQKGQDRLAVKELYVTRFYARRDAWIAVEGRARNLLRRYPTSSHAPEALSWLAQAYHRLGRADDAAQVRARLAEDHPDSSYLTVVDRELAKEPGELPQDETFVRPYRMPGLGQPGPQAGGAGR